MVGLLPGASFARGVVELRSGDLLALYTDGIIDAESEAGVRFSIERLVSLVRAGKGQSAARLVESICASVASFAGSQEPGDDVTLVVLKAL